MVAVQGLLIVGHRLLDELLLGYLADGLLLALLLVSWQVARVVEVRCYWALVLHVLILFELHIDLN